MSDPREDPKADVLAEPRRLLCQIEADIKQTGTDYDRIVREGSDHFNALHQKAQAQLDEGNVDEYVEQAHALASMRDRHTAAASGADKL